MNNLPITADTTDRQIAVRAVTGLYPDGTTPEWAERALAVCEQLDRLPEGGWPETVQAWRQARETYRGLSTSTARAVAAEARRMRGLRDKAQYQRRLSEAGKIARPFQEIVERVCELSLAAREHPDHDSYYVGVLRAALPAGVTDTAVAAISQVCAHKVRALAK